MVLHVTAELSEICEEIWLFVEREMKLKIPPYIKYILKFCGYDNCHTISTIKENDIEYFENRVRKLPNFFDGAKDVPDFSTKSTANFEIVRGHQQLIMAVKKLVKENLEQNGVDSFNMPNKRKRVIRNTTVPTKFSKVATNESFETCRSENSETFDHLKEHKSTILRKMILSLITHTPEMFARVCIL